MLNIELIKYDLKGSGIQISNKYALKITVIFFIFNTLDAIIIQYLKKNNNCFNILS